MPKVQSKCYGCGKVFELERWELKRRQNQNNRIFCNRLCYVSFIKINGTGRRTSEIISCPICEKEFVVAQYRLKAWKVVCCSKKCSSMASSKKESFICEDCGKVKKISPSKRIRYGKYCSKECMSKGNRFKSNCSYCNKEINRKNSQRRKNMFCGADCIYLWRRKRNHPSWIDGRSYLPYPPEFDKDLKFKIKQRDNHVCQLCGEDNPNRTSIHHINYDKFDCSDQNLITLCIVCNSKVNFNRGFWVGYFIGLLRQREIG